VCACTQTHTQTCASKPAVVFAGYHLNFHLQLWAGQTGIVLTASVSCNTNVQVKCIKPTQSLAPLDLNLFFPCPPIQSVRFGAKPTKPIVPQNKVCWDETHATQPNSQDHRATLLGEVRMRLWLLMENCNHYPTSRSAKKRKIEYLSAFIFDRWEDSVALLFWIIIQTSSQQKGPNPA